MGSVDVVKPAFSEPFSVYVNQPFSKSPIKNQKVYNKSNLIGLYSRGGAKSEENLARHNAPLSALKQFRDFMKNNDL